MTCPAWQTPAGSPAASIPKVLMIGDSVAALIGVGLQAQLAQWGRSTQVFTAGIAGTDITPAAGVDWVQQGADMAEEFGPSHAVVHFYGTHGPLLETQTRSEALIDALRVRGTKVVWLTPMLVDPALYTTEQQEAFAAAAEMFADLPDCSRRPNLREQMCPGAVYTDCLNLAGDDLIVREDDGTSLHPNSAGLALARDLVIRNLV